MRFVVIGACAIGGVLGAAAKLRQGLRERRRPGRLGVQQGLAGLPGS